MYWKCRAIYLTPSSLILLSVRNEIYLDFTLKIQCLKIWNVLEMFSNILGSILSNIIICEKSGLCLRVGSVRRGVSRALTNFICSANRPVNPKQFRTPNLVRHLLEFCNLEFKIYSWKALQAIPKHLQFWWMCHKLFF